MTGSAAFFSKCKLYVASLLASWREGGSVVDPENRLADYGKRIFHCFLERSVKRVRGPGEGGSRLGRVGTLADFWGVFKT